MAAPTIDLSRLIDGQKFNGFHLWIIFWCFLVQFADGFDINAAAYIAPALVKEWHLSRAQLGPLFSAGLSAGFFGPLFFGFLADRYGRRLSIIAGTFVFGIFTVAAVLSTSLGQLIVLRFLAGLGMSGALPMTVALVNEVAPRRMRATRVIVMFSGSTFGGGVPGPFASSMYSIQSCASGTCWLTQSILPSSRAPHRCSTSSGERIGGVTLASAPAVEL